MEDDGLYSNYRLTARLELENVPGTFASVANLLAQEKVNLGAVDIVQATSEKIIRDITFDVRDEKHGQDIIRALGQLKNVRVISVDPGAIVATKDNKILSLSEIRPGNRVVIDFIKFDKGQQLAKRITILK